MGDLGGIFSGILGYLGQQDTNEANAAQAQKQMDFQASQSGTAYQRATADMKAAGLNPMLAYSQGGASTPGGAMATMQNSAASGVAATSSYYQQANARSDTELKNAQAKLSEAQTAHEYVKTIQSGFSAKQVEHVVERLRQQNLEGIGSSEGKLAFERSARERLQRQGEDYYAQESGGPRGSERHPFETPQLTEMRQRARGHAAGALLDELGASRARRESDYAKSPAGLIRAPLHDLGSVVNSAAGGFRLQRSIRN